MRRALARSDDSRRRPLPSDRFDKLVKKSMVFKSEIKGALVLMEKQSIDGLKSLYESRDLQIGARGGASGTPCTSHWW